jgi:transmembrane sensor
MNGCMDNLKTTENKPQLSRALLIDAAAWVARMNGPLRTESTEQGFAQWLKDNPLHREAFVEITRDWERIEEHKHRAHVVISAVPEPAAVPDRRGRHKGPLFALAAAVAVAVIGGWLYYVERSGVATAIGEQRILTLEDGTKVSLNTATRMVVQYDKHQRRVRLESGEAFFEVAQEVDRPFVVAAGERQVTALGTAFLVRRDSDQLAVTLMEGKVSVMRVSQEQSTATVLTPGERVTFKHDVAVPELDQPSLTKLMAWQQGQVHIDQLPLSEAVAEMNRYSLVKLVIESPETAQMPLSGVFIAGQSMSFARAVAESYQLEVIDRGSTIMLSGVARRLLPAD